MSFHADFRLGIVISLVLILVGAYSYFYSTQVTYSYQTPVIEYLPQQRIQSVLVYDLNISKPVSGGGIIYFGPYNAVATPFDEMDFNLADTGWSTWLSIEALRSGVVFDNVSTRHCLQHISVWPNDTYTIKIRNLNPNQPASMYGTIHISRTYVTAEMTPYTLYQTEYASYTDYPNRSSGAIFIVLGTLAGFGTGISILLHKRRMKKDSMSALARYLFLLADSGRESVSLILLLIIARAMLSRRERCLSNRRGCEGFLSRMTASIAYSDFVRFFSR